jgi:hypothetical protein
MLTLGTFANGVHQTAERHDVDVSMRMCRKEVRYKVTEEGCEVALVRSQLQVKQVEVINSAFA